MVQPNRPARLATAAAAALLLAGAALPADTRAADQSRADLAAVQDAGSLSAPDVAPDPAVRTGVLPNGLRYALRRTTNVPGKASLRLRIAVGSLSETDSERGFAQLLARTPFDGARSAAEGTLSDIAKAHGLSFTADANTDAAASATTFSLDLATADAASLDVALTLLRGAVTEPRLGQSEIDAEWSTVIAHEHAANDLANRLFRARLAFLFEGQGLAVAGGLGDPPQKKVRRGPLMVFQHQFYRPENSVLVAVGDFDVDALEQRLRARFTPWRGEGPAGAVPAPAPVRRQGGPVRLVVEPGAPESLQLTWLAPPETATDSADRRRRDAVQRLAWAVFNRRLSALAQSAAAPFASAALFQDTQYGAARVTALLVNPQPGGWKDALKAADQASRAAATLGVAGDELPAARAAVLADLEDAVRNADTRPPALIADGVAASLAGRETITTPEQDLALFKAATDAVTADQITGILRDAFSGQGPMLFMSSPTGIDGGESAIAEALAAASAEPVRPPTPVTPAPASFRDLGEPGKIAAQRDAIDLDAVFVRFENGVRLTFRPTKLKDGEVRVKVRIGGGLAALPAGRSPPDWALQSLVDGTPYALTAEPDALVLAGAADRDELETALRDLVGPVLAPAWNAAAFARAQTAAIAAADQTTRSAGAVLADALPALAHGGDRRWAPASADDIRAASLADARAMFDPMLVKGSIEVIIVGDITEAKAIDAVATTFAALPARAEPAPTAPASPDAAAPARPGQPQTIVLSRLGGDDGRAAMLWPADNALDDPRGARLTQLLIEVLRARLADTEVSPQTIGAANTLAVHSDLVGVALPGPAAQLDALLGREASIAGELNAREIGEDELTRAKNVLERAEDKARGANAHWLDLLSGAQDDPRRLTAIRTFQASIERVTAAELRAAARRLFKGGAPIRIEVRPAGS